MGDLPNLRLRISRSIPLAKMLTAERRCGDHQRTLSSRQLLVHRVGKQPSKKMLVERKLRLCSSTTSFMNDVSLRSSSCDSHVDLIAFELTFNVNVWSRSMQHAAPRFDRDGALRITRVVEVPWLHGRHFEKLQSSRAGLSCR